MSDYISIGESILPDILEILFFDFLAGEIFFTCARYFSVYVSMEQWTGKLLLQKVPKKYWKYAKEIIIKEGRELLMLKNLPNLRSLYFYQDLKNGDNAVRINLATLPNNLTALSLRGNLEIRGNFSDLSHLRFLEINNLDKEKKDEVKIITGSISTTIEEIHLGGRNVKIYGNFSRLKFLRKIELKIPLKEIPKLPEGIKCLVLAGPDGKDSSHPASPSYFSRIGRSPFNSPINPESWSFRENLEILRFGKKFDQPVKLSCLEKLGELRFGRNFNQSVDLSNLEKLKELRFGRDFNQSVKLSGLEKLEELRFGRNFNQSVDLSSLENLSEVHFGDFFNQELNAKNIPSNIESISVGHCYRKGFTNLLQNIEEFPQLRCVRRSYRVEVSDYDSEEEQYFDYWESHETFGYMSIGYYFDNFLPRQIQYFGTEPHTLFHHKIHVERIGNITIDEMENYVDSIGGNIFRDADKNKILNELNLFIAEN